MNFKAIIFDMDGVLFDTERFYYQRRELFLNDRGISIKHLPPSFFIGGNMKQVWRHILRKDYDKWDVDQLQKDYTAYKDKHPLPYSSLIFDDTVSVIKTLDKAGVLLGLASSSTKSDILRALDSVGIRSYFKVILSGEEFVESKPNPAIYEVAARQMGCSKETILVVEDSEKGIAAGVAAGLTTWAVKDERFGMNQSQAAGFINCLSDLLSKD
ncbi:HAD family hydrolase [Streptococcus sciuri]|uniref:HAD family phosphatase n=1 Tax=Streptococcus sciuri TaxID=2973939 RepID=A0ABT2F6T4_9STRE|nr:HAD family phosphatase [Streptococcus sciuri]MCS4488149.1 HAD family phosphatase [Streptococcus sciuri]